MRIGRWFALALSVSPITTVAAQTTAPPVAPKTGPDILVQGVVDSPSIWKRAESTHVIVTSKGSEAELKRVSNNLERLHYVMARVLRRAGLPDDTIKLQVTLIDTADFFHAMKLQNLRSEEGPYAGVFSGQRYYDPREDGEVLAVARTDQIIKLSTALAEDRDFQESGDSDADSAGSGATFGSTANQPPLARSWQAVLYSAYAQHFVLTYLPAAYPRWYLDGVGALFSTLNVRRDGKIDYAQAPLGYRSVFRSYGDLAVGDVLTGQYLDTPPAQRRWTPYHAWLLTHFFLFSKLSQARSQQFARYMAAIQRGTPMAEAAKVFGNMHKLQNEILDYADHSTDFARADAPTTLDGDPLVNTLTRSSAAVLEDRIALSSRLAALPGDPAAGTAAKDGRAAWLAQLRDTVAGLPFNPEALLTEAEAECRSDHSDACLDMAERVLAKAPDNVRALAWKGTAQTQQALAAPAAVRAAQLAAARKTLARATQLGGDAPMPLIATFRSYAAAGERVPDPAMVGMAKVIHAVPAAPGPRLDLAEELIRQGQADLAQRILYPVLYGAYDSPERKAAQALIKPAGGAQAGR